MRERRAAPAARGPGRPVGADGDKTRERILAAALETFARYGRSGTSVRDIAQRARIRVSTLYHYFPSKESLYGEVQEHVHRRVRALVVDALGRSQDLGEATREVVGAIFDFFLEHRTFLQLGYRGTLDGDPRTSRDKRVSDRWLGLVEGTLEPAKARGEVKSIDPVHFMLTVDALVHWHILNEAVYRQHLGRGFEDPEVAAQTREHVVRVALRTLGLD
ncbi:MAG TPA: TetR/AcrR family transcriptional regulator [Candidatus Limnocylindria bacterium]|nr:TetR/AcrR family transcriptional regulator [Candidatus Limnocylindria bacterium]